MYAENLSPTWPEELHLRKIVGLFHLTQSEEERRLLADDYAATVGRLIESGMWPEMPPIEDFLPEEWMPKAFYDYWLGPDNGCATPESQPSCAARKQTEMSATPLSFPLACSDEDRLTMLARFFYGARSDAERRVIADDYAATIFRLIESGVWDQMPAFEDMLPDEWMPKAFYDYLLGSDYDHQ